MKRLLLGLALLALVSGCGGSSSSSSAEAFVKRITTEFSRGQTGRLWDELYPAEQALVTRARFVECEQNEGFGLRKIKVLETYNEPIQVAGHSVPSTAVSLQVSSDDGITTATLHAVKVGDMWRWVLQPADLAAYRRGACPAG